jgi:hypothetical protein
MNLTPVRIRGKRKKRASTINSPVSPMGSGKVKQLKRSISAVRKERLTRSRATLDSLPTEILEKILLYSTNLSLPRSAPLIGAKLSGRATLLRLFIWAFHDTWDQGFGISVQPGILLGPNLAPDMDGAIPKVHDGDPILQVRTSALSLLQSVSPTNSISNRLLFWRFLGSTSTSFSKPSKPGQALTPRIVGTNTTPMDIIQTIVH